MGIPFSYTLQWLPCSVSSLRVFPQVQTPGTTYSPCRAALVLQEELWVILPALHGQSESRPNETSATNCELLSIYYKVTDYKHPDTLSDNICQQNINKQIKILLTARSFAQKRRKTYFFLGFENLLQK